MLSPSLTEAGPAFCTCPLAVCRDALTSTGDVHRLLTAGWGCVGEVHGGLVEPVGKLGGSAGKVLLAAHG